jgi:predicted aconitase with swiveling domain
MGRVIRGKSIVAGEATGIALVSSDPLSFWGGYDAATGEIIDRRHPLSGKIAAGKILVIPFTRGSSTTTAVLLESVKAGTAPAGIITARTDTFLSLASIVADEMYGKPIPIVAIERDDFERIETGQPIQLATNGTIHIQSLKST